ncbi:MAG: hypothetical protein NTU62_02865 [Spirochaetes bacterium]|nr:hypothetical protein [Spirochaetota bacterium]
MNLRDTADALATLGFDHAVLPSGSEGAVLVSSDCGRLLGLWPNGRAENALWTDPGFFEALRGAARREEWMNPGGDWVWLGPDEEFLDPGTGTPPSVDPGRYVSLGDRDGCRMENRGDAWVARSGARVAFRIERRFTAFDTRELAAAWAVPHLRQAGCGETTVLEIAADAPRVRLRGIAQVPAGGETWIPLARRWAERAPGPSAGHRAGPGGGRDVDPAREAVGGNPARRRADRQLRRGSGLRGGARRRPAPHTGVRRRRRTIAASPPVEARRGTVAAAREGVRGGGAG